MESICSKGNETSEEIRGITQGICSLYKSLRIVQTLEVITSQACDLDGDKFVHISGSKIKQNMITSKTKKEIS